MPHISELFSDPNSYRAQYNDERWHGRVKSFRGTHNYCNSCRRSDVVLQVHHVNYRVGTKIWDADDTDLVTLCRGCHELLTETLKDWRKFYSHMNASDAARLTVVMQHLIQKHGGQRLIERLVNL